MNVIRIGDPNALRPLHVVMIALAIAVLASGFLLLSAAESTELVDGAVPWNEESPLRALVQLLCLNYQFPTVYAGEVKNYALGICAGLGLLALAAAVALRSPARDDDGPADTPLDMPPGLLKGMIPSARSLYGSPGTAAQGLLGLFLLWSFVSSRWSPAPDMSIGESVLLAIFFGWSICLAHGLSQRAAFIVVRILVAGGVVTTLVALAYYFGRNPTLRAKFPVGNPTLLAACLIPPTILCLGWVGDGLRQTSRPLSLKSWGIIAAAAGAMALMLWVFVLTGSRGPAIGLVAGFLAMAFLLISGRRRWIPVGLAAGMMIAAWLYFASLQQKASPTGRSETIRFRTYAWSYAWDLFSEKPLTGQGQGGFALLGDARCIPDVMFDPLVFESRIAHAHNEWLQILCDLGIVGFVLVGAVLILILFAAEQSTRFRSASPHRWKLVGMAGSLVGLCVSESFGVGLRTSAVPTQFYTLLGLILAAGSRDGSSCVSILARTRVRRMVSGIAGGVAGLLTLVLVQRDFAGARDGYRVSEKIRNEQFEDALRLAASGANRLPVQRALEGWYRLSEAHMLVAHQFQSRAADRERRAAQSEGTAPQVAELSRIERATSDEHCRAGSAALLELLRRSPGYIQHGWVGYRLNVIQADNATARGEGAQQEQFVRSAGAVLERELDRQPFDPEIACVSVGVQINFRESAPLMEVLARPLRFHRMTPDYLELLAHFSRSPELLDSVALEIQRAEEEIKARTWTAWPQRRPTPPPGGVSNPWAPEKMRLAAALNFLRGNFEAARGAAESAAAAYEQFASPPQMGAASSYAELADCRFVADLEDAGRALAAAERAISFAPNSESGRMLMSNVRDRMIDYLLALDDEERAMELLVKNGPGRRSEGDLQMKLAARYQRLFQTGWNRNGTPPSDEIKKELLLKKLEHWSARMMELSPFDPSGFALAAQLAIEAGREKDAAEFIQVALKYGLSVEDARKFVAYVRGVYPESELWTGLETQLSSPPAETDPPDRPSPDPAAGRGGGLNDK